jgi:chemotaxis protein histidine kinase CheA
LSTAAGKDKLLEVFLFIEDNVTITPICATDIFKNDPPVKENFTSVFIDHELSIQEFIENCGKDKPLNRNNQSENKYHSTTTEIKRISVDSHKLDNLMFLVSEIITVNSQLLLTVGNERYLEIRPLLMA